MSARVKTPITRPFARINGLPVAVMIVDQTLAMMAAFAAAFPGIFLEVYSGIRLYEDQVRIFTQRYVTAGNINGRRVYDTRWWKGQLWFRIDPAGTVAAPGTSNHETGRSLDLRDTGSDPGVAASFLTPRNIWLSRNCHRWGFTHTGKNFKEPWHFEQLQVADPFGGLGKPLAISSSDPGQPLTTGSGNSGGSKFDPGETTPEEEDDMSSYVLVRVKDRKGRHYALDTEFVKQITSVTSVKLEEDATGRKEREVSGKTFDVMCAVRGIPSNVFDSQGRVLNALEGGGYVHGGAWSRGRAAERVAYEAKKAALGK